MLIFSIAIRFTISARGAALLLFVLHLSVSLNTDPMPCRHLTDSVTRPSVNLYREWGSERVRDCGLSSDLPDEEDDLTNDRNVIADPMYRRIGIAYRYVG